jgi:hypothetical protein
LAEVAGIAPSLVFTQMNTELAARIRLSLSGAIG